MEEHQLSRPKLRRAPVLVDSVAEAAMRWQHRQRLQLQLDAADAGVAPPEAATIPRINRHRGKISASTFVVLLAVLPDRFCR